MCPLSILLALECWFMKILTTIFSCISTIHGQNLIIDELAIILLSLSRLILFIVLDIVYKARLNSNKTH